MNDYEELLAGAIAAVEIEPPARHRWFGRPSARIPLHVRRALTPETARSFLLFTLQLRLYNHFYCKGVATPSARDALDLPATGKTTFARRLSEANQGTGYWGGAWRVEALSDEGAVVVGDGLELRVPAGRYRRPAGSQTTATDGHSRPARDEGGDVASGDTVKLRFPKEMLGVSPGFYMAMSNRELAADEAGAVRLYWNVTPEGALRFLHLASRALNEAEIPYRLKVLNDPRRYTRCDAVLVYLNRGDFEPACDALAGAHGEVADALKHGRPAFTKPFGQSVGLAEDPGDGDSFGLHRCRLVAEGLVRAAERGVVRHTARLQIVRECFAESNVSLKQPYLNPGSSDGYDHPELMQAVERASARRGRWTASTARRGSRVTLRRQAVRGGPERYLESAAAIGDQLKQAAIWHEERCTWLGAQPPREHGPAATARNVVASLGPDLYAGAAGVALFLAELSVLTGDRGARDTARGALRHAAESLEEVPAVARLGLYSGWPGVALAAARAGRVLADEEMLAVAGEVLQRVLSLESEGSEPDLLSGTAGAIVGLLALEEVDGDTEPGGLRRVRGRAPAEATNSAAKTRRVALRLGGRASGRRRR